jgi:hypothetical protein
MKLSYQKPLVAVERFELSQSIAACTIKIGFASNTCVQNDADTPPEMRSVAIQNPMYFADKCNEAGHFDVINDFVPGLTKDQLCYHTQTNATFTS